MTNFNIAKRRTSVFLMSIALCICTIANAQDYNITDFGAKGDGQMLCSPIIQKVVDKASVNGGGRVVVPKGVFLSGTIILKDNVVLHISEGATLLGTTNPDEYRKLNRWKGFIMADGAKNIGLTGGGTIDGQGRKLALTIDSMFYAGAIDSVHYNFVEMRPKYYLRPQLIEFVGCKGIVVKDLTLKNAACWVQTHHECDDIVIENVRTESDAYWNNDGIDIQDCRNVRITGCYVNAADDGICIKSHHTATYCTENILIEDCTVRSSASAIKFGTRSHAGFKNVTIRNIKVFDTYRSAIAIECVDGGELKDVLIENISAVNTGNAIFIRLDKRHSKTVGSLENVVIRNIDCEVSFERPDYKYDIRGPDLPFFHNTFPSSITGIPGHNVKNVTLENISIRYPGRGNNGLANSPITRLDDVPEMSGKYPEFSMFKELPAWGFYIRHVEGLTMKNVRISIGEADYRPAFVLDDAHKVSFEKVQISGDVKKKKVVLHNSSKIKGLDPEIVIEN